MTTIGLCCMIQKVAEIAFDKKDYSLLYECYKDFIKYAKLNQLKEEGK